MSFSATARLVALGVLCEARAGRARGVPAPTRRLAALAIPAWLRGRVAEALLRRVEALLLPGIAAHYVARKRCFWHAAQQAVASGIERAVVLAPGCDGIGLALRELGVEVIEVLHPREEVVRARLVGSGQPPCVVADLAAAPEAIRALALDPRPTLWIAEAVLMYLPPSRAHALLRALHAARAPQTVLFSAMQPRSDGQAGFEGASNWVARWLASVREPFRWALAPQALRRVLARAGYDVIDSANEAPTEGWCAGETVYVAQAAAHRRRR